MQRVRTVYSAFKAHAVRFAVSATVAATGLAFVATNGSAYAYQFCAASATACLNAWGGGPAVNVERPGAGNNNNFNPVRNGGTSGWDWIQFNGTGLYHGTCVSDYNNDPSDAAAGLTACGGSYGTPWGANFLPSQCTSAGYNGVYYNNVHWSGFLGPQSTTVGDPFYLNKQSAWCFKIY